MGEWQKNAWLPPETRRGWWRESLDEAIKVAQSTDPQECAKRCEKLCRKALDVLRESAELQAKELQDAFTKWSELAGKVAN